MLYMYMYYQIRKWQAVIVREIMMHLDIDYKALVLSCKFNFGSTRLLSNCHDEG